MLGTDVVWSLPLIIFLAVPNPCHSSLGLCDSIADCLQEGRSENSLASADLHLLLAMAMASTVLSY